MGLDIANKDEVEKITREGPTESLRASEAFKVFLDIAKDPEIDQNLLGNSTIVTNAKSANSITDFLSKMIRGNADLQNQMIKRFADQNNGISPTPAEIDELNKRQIKATEKILDRIDLTSVFGGLKFDILQSHKDHKAAIDDIILSLNRKVAGIKKQLDENPEKKPDKEPTTDSGMVMKELLTIVAIVFLPVVLIGYAISKIINFFRNKEDYSKDKTSVGRVIHGQHTQASPIANKITPEMSSSYALLKQANRTSLITQINNALAIANTTAGYFHDKAGLADKIAFVQSIDSEAAKKNPTKGGSGNRTTVGETVGNRAFIHNIEGEEHVRTIEHEFFHILDHNKIFIIDPQNLYGCKNRNSLKQLVSDLTNEVNTTMPGLDTIKNDQIKYHTTDHKDPTKETPRQWISTFIELKHDVEKEIDKRTLSATGLHDTASLAARKDLLDKMPIYSQICNFIRESENNIENLKNCQPSQEAATKEIDASRWQQMISSQRKSSNQQDPQLW